MMAVGRDNMDLTKYLIAESFPVAQGRVASLRNFFPDAQEKNWKLQNAGMRVQIIKKDAKGHGKLEFGTENCRRQRRHPGRPAGRLPRCINCRTGNDRRA
ncbi:malate:quinone oxidoreductase [Halopseudomonas pachastrellae]|nr:malate:quinone oxidoreductase [Halopseudomonas pachastrellae]